VREECDQGGQSQGEEPHRDWFCGGGEAAEGVLAV
jgi:hypothetical protein